MAIICGNMFGRSTRIQVPRARRRSLCGVLFLGLVLLLAGCGSDEESSGDGSAGEASDSKSNQAVHKQRSLKAIKESGALRIVTRNAPTSYFIGKRKKVKGFEADLARAFAESIGVEPKFVVKNSIHGVLSALSNGQGDLAAAGLTETATRSQRFAFGPNYQDIRQKVVCNRHGPQAKDVSGLADVDMTVIGDSSYVEQLASLKQKHEKLSWQTNNKVGTETLLRRVWQQKLDCTVADSNIVAFNRRYYPELKTMFNLSDPQHLSWALPKDADALRSAVAGWLEKYRSKGQLAALHKKYYAYYPKFDFVDSRALVRRVKSRYPKYEQHFGRAADKHDLPPLLLAAQGYQESHWDPTARSPTGVRGLMMLTGRTAKSLGVRNRLDPRESIQGGARYLAKMEKKFDSEIDEPERTYFALAAYNLGYAHVRDAQRLTERLGKNRQDWSDVSSVLPLLTQKRYYKNLSYGYAHGGAPVVYVRRIRNYADIIDAHD